MQSKWLPATMPGDVFKGNAGVGLGTDLCGAMDRRSRCQCRQKTEPPCTRSVRTSGVGGQPRLIRVGATYPIARVGARLPCRGLCGNGRGKTRPQETARTSAQHGGDLKARRKRGKPPSEPESGCIRVSPWNLLSGCGLTSVCLCAGSSPARASGRC